MKKMLIIIVVFIGLVCCKSNDENVIQIGAILPLTGEYADVGIWIQQGLEIAKSDINSKQEKYKLHVLYEDSQGKVPNAISAYNKLKMQHDVKFYMTTISPVSIALKPLMQKDGVVNIVQAAHKNVIENNCPLIFRYCLTIKQEADCIFNSFKENNIASDARISLLYVNNDIGNEFKQRFEGHNFYTNLNLVPYEQSELDFKNIVASALNLDPQYIIISGYTKTYGQLVKRLREFGYQGVIFANQGFSTRSVKEAAGEAGNNVFYDDYFIPQNNSILKIEEEIKTRYNASLAPMHITTYNITQMIYNACKTLESLEPTAIVNYWRNNPYFEINDMKMILDADSQDIFIPIQLKENKF